MAEQALIVSLILYGERFTYDENGFKCINHSFDPIPTQDVGHSIVYHRAQLAFRRYPSPRNDVEALRAHLRSAENEMDGDVATKGVTMMQEYERQVAERDGRGTRFNEYEDNEE